MAMRKDSLHQFTTRPIFGVQNNTRAIDVMICNKSSDFAATVLIIGVNHFTSQIVVQKDQVEGSVVM